MTDYSKLIARVRSPFALTERDAQEIADALEAQAEEIAEFQDTVVKSISFWTHIHQKQERRIAELEAALTPLAEMYYWIEPHHYANDSIEQCNQLTVAEIRAARAALKGEQK